MSTRKARIARDYPAMTRVVLTTPAPADEDDFLAANHASLQVPPAVVVQPAHARGLPRLPARARRAQDRLLRAGARDGAIVGWINLSEIVRGELPERLPRLLRRSPRTRGQGYMTEALGLVAARGVRDARSCTALEANIQPGNTASIALVKRFGFELEGMSPRYLKIGGRWRDHERYALRAEAWRSRRAITFRPQRSKERRMSGVNGSEGHGASGQAGRGSAVPARARGRTRTTCATPRRCTRCSCAPGFAHAKVGAIDTSEALAAPGVVGVYTAADLNLEPFPTAGPPVDTPEEMRRPVLATRHGALHRRAGRRGRRRHARARRRRGRAGRRRLRPARRARRHDQGARRRRAAALPAERQPRRRGPSRRGGARGRRGARRARASSTSGSRPCRWSRARRWRRRTRTPAASSCGRRARARTPTRARSASRPGSRRSKLRVISTATGGGFGARIACYPEQIVVVALARELGRAVRYIETRSETMLEMQHGRAQVQDVEIGGTRDGKVTGLKVRVIADCGAYPADAALMPMLTGLMSSRRLRHPEGRLPLRLRRHQHDADRRLPRRRAPGGDGAGRAGDRHVRRRDRDGPGRGAAQELHHRVPAPDGHGRQLRLGRVPRGAGQVPGQRGLRGAARRAGGAARARRRQAARARDLLLRRVDRLRLRARHVRGRGGRHGHRDRRARPRTARATRPSYAQLVVEHARRAARGRAGDPVRHRRRSRAAWARRARARCRSAAPRCRPRPTRCSRRPGGSPRTCSRPTRATSRSSRARASAWRARPASAIPWARARAGRGRPVDARPEGLEGGLAARERLRDARRDVPVRHPPRGRRGRHRDRARRT